RGRHADHDGGDPHPRRQRLHGGVRGGAPGARREAHGARRRHDGDPGAHDRAPPDRVGTEMREPFAARLHFVPRALRGPHAALIRTLRGYFSRLPGWVLLTTRRRRTGLPAERRLPPALGHAPAGGRDPARARRRVTPLDHLRLLDLSRQLPGPFCSTLLADLGADVLTIAAPGDPFGTGIPFLARNKRSMTLNLKSDAGRDIFLRLAAEADVVLEGFRPGVMARLGIGWERLSALNPRLVYCAISGYGQDGPHRDRVGHDVNYLAAAGVLHYVGEAGGPPVIPGVQIADIGAGSLMAAVGILTALIARERPGR